MNQININDYLNRNSVSARTVSTRSPLNENLSPMKLLLKNKSLNSQHKGKIFE